MYIPTPTTLPEVEDMVRMLYQPNPPELISRIQEILQQVQKSPEGWQLAEHLLDRPDTNVKFFGALTIIVKLNTERCIIRPRLFSAHIANLSLFVACPMIMPGKYSKCSSLAFLCPCKTHRAARL
jgi:hypothetical protein